MIYLKKKFKNYKYNEDLRLKLSKLESQIKIICIKQRPLIWILFSQLVLYFMIWNINFIFYNISIVIYIC